MSDAFIPMTKNPPAKVKDPGLIAMVMAGAGVYNAKNGELLLLPEGRAKMRGFSERMLASLLEKADFQPVDASASDAAVYSLAERYVREYKERALLWAEAYGRKVELYGWQADAAAADELCQKAVAMTAASLEKELHRDVLCLSNVVAARESDRVLAVETVKESEDADPALRCVKCGAAFFADSVFCPDESPVGAGTAEEPVADVHTPGTHTIQLLCEYLDIPIETTLKAMLYTLELPGGEKKLLFAMIRGDRDISIPKLGAWVGKHYPHAGFRRAEAAEIVAAFGEVAGFCGPIGVPEGVQMVADHSLKDGKNFVVGGNRPDYHRTGCCWGRDFEPPLADLTLIGKETPCPQCGGALEEIFLRRLGELYTYPAPPAGETVLSCRDRDGAHEWPWRVRGTVLLAAVLLAFFEKHTKTPVSRGENQEESL